MTLDDALKTFGLKRLLAKPALKVLRDSQAKEAAARGDEDALIRINAAWAVLTGKSDAAPTDESGANGPQGLIRAHCARKSGQVFILDWTMSPRAGQGGADKIVLDNPQLISWDEDLGLFQIVGASGEAKPYYGDTNGPSSADSGLFTQGWASQFRGEIRDHLRAHRLSLLRCPAHPMVPALQHRILPWRPPGYAGGPLSLPCLQCRLHLGR